MTAQHTHRATAIDSESMVGLVRRRNAQPLHRYGQWARITMTVPSASGPCWFVSYFDGEVDVWRIHDPEARYQFHPEPAHPDRPEP